MKRPTEAWRSSTLFEDGIGYVAVCRFRANGEAELGAFLLDVMCLGAKNALYHRFWEEELEGFLKQLFVRGREQMAPACARKLVEGAVGYAQRFGLPPHPDYKKGARVLGGIASSDCDEEFTFGQNGKPLYFQGPNDSPRFVERVMRNLEKHCGAGNYHYVLVDSLLPDDELDEDEDEDEGDERGEDEDEGEDDEGDEQDKS